SSVTEDEMTKIEQLVNERSWASLPLEIDHRSFTEAKELGATALFGEKDGDVVRVVNISNYSLELCGGCHVDNTAAIGMFKITSGSGVGAGTRRIEAVTSQAAYEWID